MNHAFFGMIGGVEIGWPGFVLLKGEVGVRILVSLDLLMLKGRLV